jgi:hypothetical protein
MNRAKKYKNFDLEKNCSKELEKELEKVLSST